MYFVMQTFGCKVNQYESGTVAVAMREAGFTECEDVGQADVVIVNSCTVTEKSSAKVEQAVRSLRRRCPCAIVVLMGCFSQAFPERADMLGADIVVGTKGRGDIPTLIRRHLGDHTVIDTAHEFKDIQQNHHEHHEQYRQFEKYEEPKHFQNSNNTRAYLKIEDGCDRFCSYCIIPTARGPVRSRSLGAIAREAQHLVNQGHSELVLVGINLSCFGTDTDSTLSEAVEAIANVDGVKRIRLSSLEPELMGLQYIKRLANVKEFCPHFHLSLQSGCDKTLIEMNRHYTTDSYYGIVTDIRSVFSDAAITTDVMVGFPGESDEDFLQSLDFVRKCGFAKVHVFTYSPREGTVAAERVDQVPQAIKTQRYQQMSAVAEQLQVSFLKKQVGTQQSIIIEKRTHLDYLSGHTKNYTPVRIYGITAQRGSEIPVKITSAEENTCIGEEIKE